MSKKKLLISGGYGFIGSNFIQSIGDDYDIFVVDKRTYAANENHLNNINLKGDYLLDICDFGELKKVFQSISPDKIIHFAAESHVDRSIANPEEFINTNIYGTYNMLRCALEIYDSKLEDNKKDFFQFIHISTDEVFGSLKSSDKAFTEESTYKPNSPYSASKAASDHLVRSYNKTFDLPTTILNCSNNFSQNQYHEKLIPLTIKNALNGKEIPIYGNGEQIRDWLYVKDFCNAIKMIIDLNISNERFNIGSNNEIRNIDLVSQICSILDEIRPRKDKKSYSQQIKFVEDRKGHDIRYAINSNKIKKSLNWKPKYNFEDSLKETIAFYANS